MKTITHFISRIARFVLFIFIAQNTYSQSGNNTLFVTRDAHVRGGDFSDENYGSALEMEIKAGAGDSFLRDVYLQFDLDEISAISSARLLVYGYAQTAMNLGAYQTTTTTWSENSITWSNRPVKSNLITTSRITRTPDWVELDITDLAQDRAGRLLTVVLSNPEAINKTAFISSEEEGSGELQARLVIERESFTGNQTYYIDDESGNDSNSGTSTSSPWRTLANINSRTFLPGAQILFKAGGSWSGTIMPKGSGAAGNPIVIGSYGNGAKPKLNGEGNVNCSIDPGKIVFCTIGLSNQEYWEVNDLEITNFDASEENGKTIAEWESDNITQYANVEMPPPYAGENTLKCGILVEANNFGSVDYLHFNNLEIHGVNGNIDNKDNGGIYIDVHNFGNEIPTYFNDLLVNNCHIHDVDRTAISNNSDYSTRSLNTNTNWTPNLNYRITNSTFERSGANAVIMRMADKPLLENCLFDHCGIKESGNAAFFFNVDDGIMQYNEFRFTKANVGDRDAGGPDIDFRTKDCILQYNYLHDNDNGLLVTGGADPDSDRFNDGPIVRYNVIERDGRQPHPSDDKFVLKITGKTTNGVFHNNIIFIGEDQSDIRINRSRARTRAVPINTSYHNNIIYNLGTNSIHDYDASIDNTMSHNLYFGNPVDLATDETNKIVGNPLFANVGNGPNGYTIQSGSPAIATGIALPSLPSIDYFGNTIDRNGPISIGIQQFSGVTATTSMRLEAEDFDSMSGIQTEASTESGENVGYINDGDWIRFDDVFLRDITNMDARVATRTGGGTLEVRIANPTGTLIGSIDVGNTGGYQNWRTLNTSISEINGTRHVYLVFRGDDGFLFNVNWIEFNTNSSANKDIAEVVNATSNIVMYPSPVEFTTTVKNAANSIVTIYGMDSSVLFTKAISSDSETIDLSSLASGIYFAEVKGESSIEVIKLIKK